MDLLRSETCKFAHNFLLSLQSFGLVPTIDKPTRVHRNSATLINNIFINEMNDEVISGNVVSDISDHLFCIVTSYRQKVKRLKHHKIRDFSCFSENAFNNDLQEVSSEQLSLNESPNVDKYFSMFYNKVNKVINKHAPLKVSSRKAKQLLKPWITKGLLKSIKIKNKLFYSGQTDRYKLYRNSISKLTRVSKKLYYHNYFTTNLQNMKKTWEGINNLINRKSKNRRVISAVLKDQTTMVFRRTLQKFQIYSINTLLQLDKSWRQAFPNLVEIFATT